MRLKSGPMVSIVGAGVVVGQRRYLANPFGTATNSDGDLVADLERYEGMLVRFEQPLSVSDLRNLERFGSVRLSQGGRLYQFTNANQPDPEAYAAHKSANARRSITLDDGNRAANPARPRFLDAGIAPGYSIRAGDTVAGLTGNSALLARQRR